MVGRFEKRKLIVFILHFTSDLNKAERVKRLECFRKRNIQVLVAPKILDEGIDLPEADVGIIVSASRSRRQMIQRMGRIIRPKKDKHPATFFILYVKDTFEDPAKGAHDSFLSEMMDTAEDTKNFEVSESSGNIFTWFKSK